MQSNQEEVQDTSKEQEGVEKDNTQVEVIKEVVEDLDTRDSKQLPQQFVHQAERIENSKFSTLPSEVNSFALIKQTAQILADIEAIATVIMKSGLSPLKNVPDITLAIITGNQYNLPFMTSINNIYPVNGKPAMSTHLHRALVLDRGIVPEKIYNYEPIYAFVVKKVKEDGTKQNIPVGSGTLKDRQEGWIASIEPIDRITKYKFTRLIKRVDGSYREITTESEFKLSDAIQAGLASKDNWKNFPQRMLDARAFSIGAKEIASDILLGIYTISELAEQNNLSYTISNNLEESIVQ